LSNRLRNPWRIRVVSVAEQAPDVADAVWQHAAPVQLALVVQEVRARC